MSDFWSSVREGLRGTRQDFTQVPIRRAVLLLAVPMILEMAMESLFVIVDIFWVSRLGAEAVASVGLTEAMFTLIYSIAAGLGIGATATGRGASAKRNRNAPRGPPSRSLCSALYWRSPSGWWGRCSRHGCLVSWARLRR
jgi:hypothetical protein